MVVTGIYGETYYMNRDIGELPNNNKKKVLDILQLLMFLKQLTLYKIIFK